MKRVYSYEGIDYKSQGELKIAKFLTKNNINFIYEKELKLKRTYDETKFSLIYPDFYIPSKKLIIEYFGMEGENSYDKITKSKKETYKFNNYDLISIYPHTRDDTWQNRIFTELNQFSLSKIFQNLRLPKLNFNFGNKTLFFIFKLLIFFGVLLSLTLYLFDFKTITLPNSNLDGDLIKVIQSNNDLHNNLKCGMKGIDVRIKLINPERLMETNGLISYNYGDLKVFFNYNSLRNDAGFIYYTELGGVRSKICKY